MAKRVEKKLSARAVATLTEKGRHSDGGGLYLSIDGQGRKRWVFMYTRNGKRTELGLGTPGTVTLKGAREAATKMRVALDSGKDPRAERSKGRGSKTFGECADEYIETMRSSWKSKKHADQWKMTLTEYAKSLRDLVVSDIETEHVLKALKPVWERTPETGERLRGRIERVLDAAKAQGLRGGENPARWKGHLNQLLPKRQRLTRGHHTALSIDDTPDFIKALREREAVAARALEFTILTAVRTTETRQAKWEEIDLKKAMWTIPPERMKAAREHRVPLTKRAVEILQEVQKISDGDLVFPGPKKDKGLSSGAMSNLLGRMGVEVTVHGFRSTFRDWASERTGFPHEVCEMALAHKIKDKSEAAYRRGDLFEKRRALMDAWSRFCDGQSENVEVLSARALAS